MPKPLKTQRVSTPDHKGVFGQRVAPTCVLKYNIRTRSLADPGAIEAELAVENDVVPFDRADVLEQGFVNAFLGDSPRSHRLRDLLGWPIGFETERSWPGVYNNVRLVLRYLTT